MIYLIGSGYLGSSLAEYFADRGYDMQVLGRNHWPNRFNEDDTIINCASSGYRRANHGIVQAVTDNFHLPVKLDQIRNGANMIHFSSWTEECACNNVYAWSKALATSFLKGKCHICMCCSVWGGKYESPEKFIGTFLRACAKNKPYVVTHPFRQRDFVHIEQLAPAVEQLTKHKDYAKRYFATGRLRSFWYVANKLSSMTELEFPNVTFTDDMSANYDWHPVDPIFEDTFDDDLKREWKKICEL